MLVKILGLFVVYVGFMMVYKTEWLLQNFGRIGFFEKHLGTEGGSRLGYKLTGILAMVIGFMMVTGMITGFMEFILYPLTKYSQPM